MKPLQFDLFSGKAQTTYALEKLEQREWIDEARRVAVMIAKKNGRVCADDVRPLVPEAPSNNCWGGVFPKSLFYMSGETRARHSAAHGRWVHWWSLRGER